MKNFSKTIKSILIISAMILSINASADPGNGRGNTDGDITNNTGLNDPEGIPGNCGHGPNQHAGNACGGGTTSVPLDGGLGILLVGAAAFGVKKLRDNKNGAI